MADSSWIGAPSFGRGHTNYDHSRGWFNGESDFPGPRTMTAAANWLKKSAPRHRAKNERFFLLVDEFDPHEPFDTPGPWASMYDDSWQGPNMIWPPYSVGAIAEGTITAREGQQIRAQYGAKLSMIDHWFGKVLDALDRTNAWQDTAVVLCTDHGHYLGESDASSLDLWGKLAIPVYKMLGHIPMCIAWSGVSPRTSDAPLSMWSNRWSTMPIHSRPDISRATCCRFGRMPKNASRSFTIASKTPKSYATMLPRPRLVISVN